MCWYDVVSLENKKAGGVLAAFRYTASVYGFTRYYTLETNSGLRDADGTIHNKTQT